jgi:hypothetical protein
LKIVLAPVVAGGANNLAGYGIQQPQVYGRRKRKEKAKRIKKRKGKALSVDKKEEARKLTRKTKIKRV